MAKNQVKVEITGDAKDLVSSLGVADGALGGFSGKLSSFAGSAGAIAATAGAAIVAGIGAAGVGLYKIGEEFDAAFDSIRVTTGATGPALESLKEDFRQVVATVPADFATAGDAIGQLSQRLGLTGPSLQGVASQVLELSRLTGSDLNSTIAATTRVMGDWGVANDQIPGTLDAMFRASQATGISVDALSEKVVQFGAPLRQMGFSFEESAALIGKFEREGVNGELVLGSMRQALGRMAKAGEPAVETFRRVTGEIAAAGSTSEANALALELFGARAGPDMAAAIREGRFEVGNLVDTIANGSETILGASADTMDFGEKFQLLKNRVFLALEPVAMRVFDAIGQGMDALGPIFETVQTYAETFFSAFSSGSVAQGATGIGASVQEMAVTARDAFDTVRDALARVGAWFMEHRETIAEVVSTAVSAYATYARVFFRAVGRAFEIVGPIVSWVFDNVLRPLAEWVATDGVAGFRTFASAVSRAWAFIRDAATAAAKWFLTNVAPTIVAALQFASAAFERIRQVVQAVWQFIRPFVEVAVRAIGAVIGQVLTVVQAVWSGAWTAIRGVVSSVWAAIQSIVTGALTIIRNVFQFATAFLQGNWSGAWNAIRGVVQGATQVIGGVIGGFAGVVRAILSGVGGFISGVFRGPLDAAIGAVRFAVGLITGAFESIRGGIGRALSGVADAIAGPFRSAFSGIRSLWNSTVGGFRFTVPDWIPFVGGRSFSVPNMYTGGVVKRGGVAVVGELGPEIVELPTGSKVYPSGFGPAGMAGGGVVYELHFHGPVTRDAERWLVETIARANRQGLATIPGVRV